MFTESGDCSFCLLEVERDKYKKALETLKYLAQDSLDVEKSYNLTATEVLALVELELKEQGDEKD